MLSVTKPNEIWILHREDFETQKEGNCNLYVLLDAFTGYCFGFETSVDLPELTKISDLIIRASKNNTLVPQKIVIQKSDPYVENLKKICDGLKIDVEELPEKYITPFIQPFIDSLQGFRGGSTNHHLTQGQQEEAKALVPDTYGPCPCASGKKFKFCCQKAFKPIVFAMCEAQEGRLESALRYMKEAEEKVGRTAEVVSRLGVCWSFFDLKKSHELYQEALSINPDHPRLNYLLGIEAAEQKDYRKAVGYYQKAIANYPVEDKYHLNEAHNNLGTAFFNLESYQEAKESWEKALVLMPRDQMVKNNLFECIYFNPNVPEEIREVSPFIAKFLGI
jgi:tetratricopeptide (TPR) repeat protein